VYSADVNDIESVRLMALSLIDGWFRFCGHRRHPCYVVVGFLTIDVVF